MSGPTAASSRGLPRISKQSIIINEYGVYAKTEIMFIYVKFTVFCFTLPLTQQMAAELYEQTHDNIKKRCYLLVIWLKLQMYISCCG